MAFNTKAAARSNNSNASAPRNESWKAQGFINFYLPSKEGGNKKLGAISLRKANPAEAKLASWLEESADNIKSVAAKLMTEYNSTVTAAAYDIDFGDTPAVEQSEDEGSKMRGYLNFFLPTNDGGRKKLGAIGLRKNHPVELRLAVWMEESDDHIQQVVDKLILQYNSAEARANADFAV